MTAVYENTLSATLDAFGDKTATLTRDYLAMQDQLSAVATELLRARKSRVDELLEKERLGDRLATLLEVLPGALLVLDGEGIIIECNRSSIELFGKPLTGVTWSELLLRVSADKSQSQGELRLKDGRCLSLARRSLPSESGEILLLMDISETERLQSLLQRQNRLSAMGEMSARLAHQIRTPLSAAVLYLSQIQQDISTQTSADQKLSSFANSALARLRDLEVLVDDMLIYAGGVNEVNDEVDLTDLAASVIETLTPQYDIGIRLELAPSISPIHIKGNFHALHSALLNVVTNALQVTEDEQSLVSVSVSVEANTARISVCDQGPGIPSEFYDRIFEPFFSTRSQGTGLGLAVVHSVVSAHGGNVEVHDLTDGAQVSLNFPLPGDPLADRVFYRDLDTELSDLHV